MRPRIENACGNSLLSFVCALQARARHHGRDAGAGRGAQPRHVRNGHQCLRSRRYLFIFQVFYSVGEEEDSHVDHLPV